MSASKKDPTVTHLEGGKRFVTLVSFPCPGRCGRTAAAGHVEPGHTPAVLHPSPMCATFDALEPDELLILANKAFGETDGFDA